MGARKPRLMRIPASVRMAGYTIPVVWVDDLHVDGDYCAGVFITEDEPWGPFIALNAKFQGRPTSGETFMHELLEAAGHYAGLDVHEKAYARYTHDHLSTVARYLWEAMTTAHYPRRK